jgi:predicted secreted protein
MNRGLQLTRRRLITGAGFGLAAGVLSSRGAWAQKLTDLEGFDPLWPNPEEAIKAFMGNNTKFLHEGLHLDLPQHADIGSSVPITVRLDSEMTKADYPMVVHIIAHKNPSPPVMSAWFTPEGGRAEFSSRIRLEQSQKVTAVALMSDGRNLRTDVEVGVSLGACGQVGIGDNDDVAAFKPETRVSVPLTARRGQVVPIRALISHPQETGMRRDSSLGWIDQRIISQFGCRFRDKLFFHARFYPAVATNPYIAFYARVEESGTFDFSWYDITDITYTNKASILVT